MDMDLLGQRMRRRRLQLGLTQMALAQRTGIIQGDISLLERGGKHALWATTLARLAEGLGCSLDYLAGRTEDPTPLRKRPRRRTPAPVGEE
jgi:transcriptional regulator with XRE-family HTH domain